VLSHDGVREDEEKLRIFLQLIWVATCPRQGCKRDRRIDDQVVPSQWIWATNQALENNLGQVPTLCQLPSTIWHLHKLREDVFINQFFRRGAEKLFLQMVADFRQLKLNNATVFHARRKHQNRSSGNHVGLPRHQLTPDILDEHLGAQATRLRRICFDQDPLLVRLQQQIHIGLFFSAE